MSTVMLRLILCMRVCKNRYDVSSCDDRFGLARRLAWFELYPYRIVSILMLIIRGISLFLSLAGLVWVASSFVHVHLLLNTHASTDCPPTHVFPHYRSSCMQCLHTAFCLPHVGGPWRPVVLNAGCNSPASRRNLCRGFLPCSRVLAALGIDKVREPRRMKGTTKFRGKSGCYICLLRGPQAFRNILRRSRLVRVM